MTSKRSSPVDPVRHVSTITITRGGLPVATVSPYTPAVVESSDDVISVHVTGDVSGTTTAGELGFLELVWNSPTSAQAGEYECSITGITERGHSVSVSSSLEVENTQVDIHDVIGKLRDLEKMIHEQNVTNALQQQYIHLQQANTTAQQAVLDKQQHQLDILSAEVKESRHVETGQLHCGGSSGSWPAGGGWFSHGYFHHQMNVSTSFKTAYLTAPVVFLSVDFLYISKDQHVHYATQLQHVDQHGFSIRCGSGTSGFLLEDLGVTWIAVPV